MFTGLIQHIGTVSEVTSQPQGKTISVTVDPAAFLGFKTVKIGDSISISGVCTTVISLKNNGFTVNLMQNSLKCTTLDDLTRGNPVNLELAMSAQDRFGGHVVTGHIDAVGKISKITTEGISKVFSIETDTKYIVKKGSIALNGVSLTVSNVQNGLAEVSLIPHTLENTTFKFLREGDFLNIEYDILAKYVEKFTHLNNNNSENNSSKIDEKFLLENGF